MNLEQKARLEKAYDLITDVQIELIKEDDKKPEAKKTGEWTPLYRMRIDLRNLLKA